MAKKSTSSHKTIVVLGHEQHGKTTLIEAMRGQEPPFELVEAPPLNAEGKLPPKARTAAKAAKAGLLVVDAGAGPYRGARAHVELATKVGLDKFVVAVTKLDTEDDKELLELLELEIRELLNEHELRGNATKVLRVSATEALDGKASAKKRIKQLIDACAAIL